MRKIIAITGKIGSGKSTVGQILREKGFTVVDCDELSRRVAGQPQTLAEVAALLGKSYVEGGVLQRGKIRKKIFGDEKLLAAYNAVFFPKIQALLREETEKASDDGIVFAEIPLIDAFPFPWTEIWRVECAENTRKARVAARDNVTEEEAETVSARQTQYAKADVLLQNDGDVDALKDAVLALAEKYK